MNETNDLVYAPTSGISSTIQFISTFPIVLSIFIIAGNSMVIGACNHFSNKKSNTLAFILHLSIADVATGIGMVFNVIMRIHGNILFYKIPCLLSFEIFFTMALISVNLLACTTFDRFLSICKREKHQAWNTGKSVKAQICCSYFLGVIIGLLPFLGFNQWKSGMKCNFKDLYPPELYLVKSSFMFLGFGASFFLYIFILRKAWQVQSGRHFQVSRTAAMRQRNGFLLAKLVGIVTILNTICWMPYSLVTFMFGITYQAVSAKYLDFAFLLLGFTNSLINPVIYAWNRQDFRAVWRKWFRCRTEVKNVNSHPRRAIFVTSAVSTENNTQQKQLTSTNQ
ncbi:adenosine receptor A3-like [Saccostrea cucullata]|uniref:adenosine receptor A3-like n=1 Tax=Saccostrea cuccullata TaxID=36930 RepID=UPI002ED60CE5